MPVTRMESFSLFHPPSSPPGLPHLRILYPGPGSDSSGSLVHTGPDEAPHMLALAAESASIRCSRPPNAHLHLVQHFEVAYVEIRLGALT